MKNKSCYQPLRFSDLRFIIGRFRNLSALPSRYSSERHKSGEDSSPAQNDICGVVILNEVKDLIFKLSHYQNEIVTDKIILLYCSDLSVALVAPPPK
jgi:hypothetical protein